MKNYDFICESMTLEETKYSIKDVQKEENAYHNQKVRDACNQRWSQFSENIIKQVQNLMEIMEKEHINLESNGLLADKDYALECLYKIKRSIHINLLSYVDKYINSIENK